jgi:chromosome partitioning protein
VGKTTTAIAVADALATDGYRVLLVDLDPQASATAAVGYDPPERDTLYALLSGYAETGDPPAADRYAATIRPVAGPGGGFDLLPTSIDLSAAELAWTNVVRREYLLADVLAPLADSYDWILLDCPPALGLLTLNALTAAHAVLIPTSPEYLAVRGLGMLLNTIQMVRRKRLNPQLGVLGILITMQDNRKSHHKAMAERVAAQCEQAHIPLLGTIPTNAKANDAAGAGVPLTRYSGGDTAGDAYRALARYLEGASDAR